MSARIKRSLALLVVLAILSLPLNALAAHAQTPEDPQVKAASMIGDALIARPAGMVMTVAGFGLFLIASPFALLGGNAGEAWDAMVVYPARFTFARPLGKFN